MYAVDQGGRCRVLKCSRHKPGLELHVIQHRGQELSLIDGVAGEAPKCAERATERTRVSVVANLIANEHEDSLDIALELEGELLDRRSAGLAIPELDFRNRRARCTLGCCQSSAAS